MTRRPPPAEISFRNMRFLIIDCPTDRTLPQFVEVSRDGTTAPPLRPPFSTRLDFRCKANGYSYFRAIQVEFSPFKLKKTSKMKYGVKETPTASEKPRVEQKTSLVHQTMRPFAFL